jgi:hypothetical protein
MVLIVSVKGMLAMLFNETLVDCSVKKKAGLKPAFVLGVG